jgi:hypothetical protein
VSVTLEMPGTGGYHWQARTVDLPGGTTSTWMPFGLNAADAPDFSVVPAPPPSKGGGGGGGGCGATGLEGLVLASVLVLFRRLRPFVAK